jgi:hypothetical protein
MLRDCPAFLELEGSAVKELKGVSVMNQEIFKAYDIRGVYPDDLNEGDVWEAGHATVRFLPSLTKGYEQGRAESTALRVGQGMETHSGLPAQAPIETIRSASVGATDLGTMDTSRVYVAVNYQGASGGMQVTASHNPAKHNGFKISGKGAIPIGVDIGPKENNRLATAPLHTGGTVALSTILLVLAAAFGGLGPSPTVPLESNMCALVEESTLHDDSVMPRTGFGMEDLELRVIKGVLFAAALLALTRFLAEEVICTAQKIQRLVKSARSRRRNGR